MTPESQTANRAFAEILAASFALDELPDIARVQAWASSVLGVWGEAPEAAAIDQEFLDWLTESDDERAPGVFLAVASLLSLNERPLEQMHGRNQREFLWADHLGPARPTRAWTIRRGSAASLGIGFLMSDTSQHSLLADIVDDQLASLVVAPGPDDLFDGSEDLVSPSAVEPATAGAQMVEAWDALVQSGSGISESVYVNGAIAQRRLSDLTGQDLNGLFRPEVVASQFEDPLDPTERAELNAWAISVLDTAAVGAGVAGDSLLLDPVDPARIAAYPGTEQEAFRSLEWADWLGVVIGLSRLPADTEVEPTMLVDQINRCPEVTSSIPKKDRSYYEWAFSLVLPLWRQAGVLDSQHRLTAGGADNLIAAMRKAWASLSPETP